ncbi:LamG domain-containing protein [Streptomyces sp. Root264]|uniref:LamG domain-containing protein n=1 Tax=Streptomyces sp. Root264 TaxID=1736503 RepID=UPI00099E2DF9|nr:LamG domain-containing protein [Streptomyces sp. Root264]
MPRRPGPERGRRVSAATAVLVVLSGALVLPGQLAAASPAEADSAPLTEAQQALAEAEKSGQRVEVTGERTDRTTTFANPDGFTLTLEQSVVPVRVSKPGGGWQKPDATLEKRSDGSVGPKAAAVSIAFSAGGEKEPLARIAGEGTSLELQWPGKLPAPRLDGAKAVYDDVLPDVDLQVTATPESFQPVFVVKTPEAAGSEELKKLTFGLKAQGLDVRKGAAGNLAAVDGSGRTVFRAPPARMWDSAGEGSGQTGAAGKTTTQLMRAQPLAEETTELSDPSDPSELAPSGSGLEPGQGDKIAKMDVAVTKDSLSVVPDATMLSRTKASAFPLFIDPTVTWGGSERTLLRSDGYESYGWSNGDDGQGKGAGKCGSWQGYYCGPGYVQKLYYEFSPASLKGKKVLDATFRVTEPWAFQCDPRWVDLVRTNNISSATTWSSRPAELDLMVDVNVSAGRGSLCSPDAPDAPIEFNDNPSETNENLTSTVANFAAGRFARLTLEIKAHDESDPSAWKRFKNDAVLAVKYVAVPALPTEVGLVTGTGTGTGYACSTNAAEPLVVSSPNPQVQGRPRTAPGGSVGASLRMRWRTEKATGTTWEVAHTDVDGPTSGYVGNLVKQTRALPTLKEGVLYRLKALTLSFYEGGSNRQNTGYTTPCYFKVDAFGPKEPQVAISSPYAVCLTDDCLPKGGPGQTATFTFKAAEGDTNVVGYEYSLNSGATWVKAKKVCAPWLTESQCAVLPEQSPTFIGWRGTFTPDEGGTYRLTARARDNVGSGRPGTSSVVAFKVDDGSSPVGQWHFAEPDGVAVDSTAADGTTGHSASLSGGAVRDDRGRRGVLTRDAKDQPLEAPVTDRGLSLNGTTAYAATTNTVLDTARSYTVSAWVRVDVGASGTMTVLSQAPESGNPFAGKYSPFGLSYDGASNTWSMSVLADDGGLHKAAAQRATPRGVWTHVAGVHDAENKKVSLYLNGTLQATVDAGTAWKATGPLQIGRGLWAGAYTDYLHGSADEVSVWQSALTGSQISKDAQLWTSDAHAGVELVADWSADRGVGDVIADTTSGYARSLALVGGASLDGESIVLDGVDDAATTAGPVVDDTGSFTVTVLVSLDSTKLLSKEVGYTAQVLGQRTADGSAWGFWYEMTDKVTVFDQEAGEEKTVPQGFWRFGRLNADGKFSAVASENNALLDGMVRMTGVVNAQDGTIGLYLGAVSNGDRQAFTAKIGTGDFAVGKGFSGNAWKHYLPGRVAEVRLWAGAMAGSEQVEETVGD